MTTTALFETRTRRRNTTVTTQGSRNHDYDSP
jgi:hypothetical protein